MLLLANEETIACEFIANTVAVFTDKSLTTVGLSVDSLLFEDTIAREFIVITVSVSTDKSWTGVGLSNASL